MTMVSLVPKGTPKESSKATGGVGPAKVMGEDTQPPPTLHLSHKHLEKLLPDGTPMPPVGSKIHINGLAHVRATSEDHDSMTSPGKGKPRRSMTLHMHKMEMGVDGPENDVEQEEESKKGAKAEMDKALSKQQGSESKKGGKKGLS